MPWKTPKQAYRVLIEVYEPDDDNFTVEEDILEEEITPDAMSNFYTFWDWFACDGYEIIKVKPIEIWDWKEMLVKNKWRGFYDDFGDGEDLSIEYMKISTQQPIPWEGDLKDDCCCSLCQNGLFCFNGEGLCL